MRKRFRIVPIVAVLAVTAVAAACGDDDDDDETTQAATTAATAAESATTEAETATGATAEETATTGEETSTTAEGADGDWATPNGDWGNTRVAQTSISSENVQELGVAWQVPITATGTFGGYASTPIILDGVVFTQDLNSNVQAIDLESGEVRWTREFDSPTVGPNGVAVADGRVYGATVENAFALDAETGEILWESERMVRNDKEGIDMAPGVNGDLVYVSTVPGNTKSFYAGDGQGVVWALNAETGETVWKFETVPADLWGNKEVNSGGGLWHPPAFDDQGGMYFSVANPAPFPGTKEFPWATSRPGPNKDTNTLVKLNAETGEVQWKNQVLPHDLYDWDLHLPPVLVDTEDGRQLVLTAGKMGYVYAMDRESGETVWKTAVGRHSGNDDDNQRVLEQGPEAAPETPFELYPGFLGGVETQMAVTEGVVFAPIVNLSVTIKNGYESQLNLQTGTGEMVALDVATGEQLWQKEFDTPVYGAATIANDLVFTTTFDGTLWALDRATGEEVWSTKMPAGTNATVAIAGDTVVTAASYPQSQDQKATIIAYRLGATGEAEGGATTGEDEGTTTGEEGTTTGEAAPPGETTAAEGSAADGEQIFATNCASCHTLAAANASGTVGPNLDQSQLDQAAIQEKVTNGGGGMPAFGGRLSDAEIQAVAAYVAENRDPDAEGGGGGGGP